MSGSSPDDPTRSLSPREHADGASNRVTDDAGSWEERLLGFGARLNDRHLFAAAADADEFRWPCDQRVPEHAPFFVYALWQVRS